MCIVLVSDDLARTRRFYELLGIDLLEERHGGGVTHFSFVDTAASPVELYPRRPGYRSETIVLGIVVGFELRQALVEDLVTAGGVVLDPLAETSRGSRVRMSDPDGRLVEIFAK